MNRIFVKHPSIFIQKNGHYRFLTVPFISIFMIKSKIYWTIKFRRLVFVGIHGVHTGDIDIGAVIFQRFGNRSPIINDTGDSCLCGHSMRKDNRILRSALYAISH